VVTQVLFSAFNTSSTVPKVSGLFASMFKLVSVDIIAQGGTFKTMDMVPGEYKEETFPV
jgi:hypothetical protein